MELDLTLTAAQLLIVSSLATGGIWLLTFVWSGLLKQPKPRRDILKTLVFVVSVGLAWLWIKPVLPELPPFAGEPFAFAAALLDFAAGLIAAAIVIFKFAQLVFDALWAPFMEWLDKTIAEPIHERQSAKAIEAGEAVRAWSGFFRPKAVPAV